MAASGVRGEIAAADSLRRLGVVAGAIAAVLICVLAAPRLAYVLTHETTDDAYVDAYAAVVTARVSGTVVSVDVQPGRFVKRGAVLARLDDTDAKNDVARLEQTVAAARADLAEAQFEAADATQHRSAELLRSQALTTQSQARSDAYRLQAESAAADAAAFRDDVAQSQAALKAAMAAVPAARTRLTNAQAALSRMQHLANAGYVSATQVEGAQNDASQALAAYQAAQAAVESARANYAGAKSKTSAQMMQASQLRRSASAEAQGESLAQAGAMENSNEFVSAKRAAVQSRQAALDSATEQLKLAQYRLSEMVLRSPVDGYVASRPAAVGQLLQNGDTAVVVMPTKDLFVTANFKETQFGRIRDGAEADVHIDSYPGIGFHGHVDALGAAAQSALSIMPNDQISGNFVKITQRVPVRVIIDRVNGVLPSPLRPGMSAEVSVAH